jgi:protoporphyrinogen/coproporphyrinogen III oxidase
MRTQVEELDGLPLVLEQGPTGWLGTNPLIEGICAQLKLKIIESQASDSHRYLVHRGRLLPVPQSLGKMVRSPLLSVREKLRAASEPWADFAADGTEETVKEFFARRFGPGFTKKMVAPIVRGLFAGDYETMSLHAALPELAAVELRFGSITRALKKHPEFFGQKLHSLELGLGQLARAMAADLGDSFRPNTEIDTVVREQGWWFLYCQGVQVGAARQLAICLPSAQAALVLRDYLPGGMESMNSFHGYDLASVSLLYPRDQVQDACAGFGILAPADHPSAVLNVQFAHGIFPQHVPAGYVLLRGLLGGERHPQVLQMTDAEMADQLANDLNGWLGIDQAPLRQWVTRAKGGVAHYGLGHAKNTRKLLHALHANKGLYLGGDAFFGIGIHPALVRGKALAEAIISPEPATPDLR